jgi:hypothetical protein
MEIGKKTADVRKEIQKTGVNVRKKHKHIERNEFLLSQSPLSPVLTDLFLKPGNSKKK